jgi:hypothetical protein
MMDALEIKVSASDCSSPQKILVTQALPRTLAFPSQYQLLQPPLESISPMIAIPLDDDVLGQPVTLPSPPSPPSPPLTQDKHPCLAGHTATQAKTAIAADDHHWFWTQPQWLQVASTSSSFTLVTERRLEAIGRWRGYLQPYTPEQIECLLVLDALLAEFYGVRGWYGVKLDKQQLAFGCQTLADFATQFDHLFRQPHRRLRPLRVPYEASEVHMRVAFLKPRMREGSWNLSLDDALVTGKRKADADDNVTTSSKRSKFCPLI